MITEESDAGFSYVFAMGIPSEETRRRLDVMKDLCTTAKMMFGESKDRWAAQITGDKIKISFAEREDRKEFSLAIRSLGYKLEFNSFPYDHTLTFPEPLPRLDRRAVCRAARRDVTRALGSPSSKTWDYDIHENGITFHLMTRELHDKLVDFLDHSQIQVEE